VFLGKAVLWRKIPAKRGQISKGVAGEETKTRQLLGTSSRRGELLEIVSTEKKNLYIFSNGGSLSELTT